MKAKKFDKGGKGPTAEAVVKAKRRTEMFTKAQAATAEANMVAIAAGGKPNMKATSGMDTEEYRQKAKIAANLRSAAQETIGGMGKTQTPASTEEYHGKYAAIKPKSISPVIKLKKFEQGGKIKAKKLQKTAEEAKKLAMALWVENYRNGIKTDKGKAANYPLAPWMKEYDFSGRPTYKTSDTGGTKAEAQRAAEMPSLSSTMGLGELKGRYLMRGRFEDIEGVSDNEKYDRKQANPNVKFMGGGKMKKKGK